MKAGQGVLNIVAKKSPGKKGAAKIWLKKSPIIAEIINPIKKGILAIKATNIHRGLFFISTDRIKSVT